MLKELKNTEKTWVEYTLNLLSLREKIAQTAIEHISRLAVPDFSEASVAKYLEANPVGSIFFAKEIIKGEEGSANVNKNIIETFQRRSKIPLLIAGDLEHGAGSAIKNMTKFPDMMAMGAARNEGYAYDFGKCTAIEGSFVGFNWTFSPVVDLLLNWMNPIVSNRSLGSMYENVVNLAKSIMQGMQQNGLAACAKHFPGDGVDFKDQHICTSVNSLSEQEWWKTYGAVFQSMIDSGVLTIMIGHIALSWAEEFDEEKQRYRPATVSKRIMTDLLRQSMGFEGVIVSDALDMGGYVGWDSYEKRTIESFNNGIDAMLWPGKDYINLMERAVNDRRVSIDKLNDSVRRILELKVRLGLLNIDSQGNGTANEAIFNKSLDKDVSGKACELSRKIAAGSITLVRNRKKLLPLDKGKVKRILIGKMTKIYGGKEFSIDYLVEKLKGRGIEIGIIDNWDPATVLADAETAACKWDAFIMPFMLRTHGLMNTVRPVGDSAMAIWSSQMLEGLDPIVISMSTPFLLRDMPYLDTLVNTYSSCDDSIDMLVRALFGEIPFTDYSPVDTGGW